MSAQHPARLAVLVSGSGTNLQAIIDAIAAGNISASLVGVLSDRPEARGLDRARSAGVPAVAVDFRAYADRADYDARLEKELARLEPDLVILAGYMRILPADIVNAYRGRMLNIHPSLLPAYPGLHTYARVLEAGDAWHGTTVHYVVPELDAGPGIIQYRVAVRPDDTEPTLKARVQRGEYLIYPQAIDWCATGRALLTDDGVLLDGRRLDGPFIMDEQ
jgi:phosphoribosylglycinamide formyltransferase-1